MTITGACVPNSEYWKDPEVLREHAKRRRERYAQNPEVAKAERERQRRLYREKQGADFVNPARDSLMRGIPDRDHNVEEISELIGRASPYVGRLIAKGLWPDPRHAGASGPRCFTAAQTRRLLAVFADHVDNVASTYRADHTETTKALFDAIGSAPAEEGQ